MHSTSQCDCTRSSGRWVSAQTLNTDYSVCVAIQTRACGIADFVLTLFVVFIALTVVLFHFLTSFLVKLLHCQTFILSNFAFLHTNKGLIFISQWSFPSQIILLERWWFANALEGVENRKLLYSVDGNANWCGLIGKQWGSFSKINVALLRILHFVSTEVPALTPKTFFSLVGICAFYSLQ